MNNKVKKILFCIILFLGLIIIRNKAYATTISISPSNPKVGDTVKITVSVPNVNTADVTANVSGVVSGTIKVVNGDLSGAAKTFSNSAEYKCTTAGTIKVSISDSSTAVLNGNYVNVGASVSTTVSAATSPATTTTTNNTQTTTETQTEDKKSSNANLSNLGIRPNDFSGFRAATTSYNVTVPKDVEEVELYATAQDSKATVTGTGKKKLEIGKNELSVTVKAEDGTTKTYTVNVIRDESEATEEEEKTETEDPEEVSKGLAQLKFEGLELKPEFKTDVYEYEIDYKGEETTFNVTAIATDADYEVEVTGNEELKDGENYITILVSDKEGNNVATYQVKVNKNVITDNDVKEAEKKLNNMKKTVLISAIGLGILLFIIIVVVIVKRVRNQEDDWEYEDDNEEEIPEYKGNNQLEDFDDDMKYTKLEETNVNDNKEEIEEDNFIVEEPEEKVEYQEDIEEEVEEKPRRKHKGKRFK